MDRFEEEGFRKPKYPLSSERRFIIVIIDVIVSFILMFVIGNYVLPNNLWQTLSSKYISLTIVSFYILYRFFSILILNKTLGMLILRTYYLDDNGNIKFSFRQKFLASFMISSKMKEYTNK